MSQNVAVIGLGSMGLGMARTLLAKGWQVSGCDLSAEARDRLRAHGGEAHDSPGAAAAGRSLVVSVVVNAAQTRDVLFGHDGVAASMAAGGLFVSCATMSPDDARSIADRVEALGLHYLDAPISGGAAKAATGDLTVMASGSAQAFEAAAGLLDAVSARVFRLGDAPGAGSAVKMINQLLAGVHIAAAGEAMVMAARLGLDLPAVYEVITASAGNSWMFENRVPHVLDGDYRPLSSVEIFVKDLGIIGDMARDLRYPAPIAAAALQMYLAAAGAGLGKQDDSAVAKVYASLSGVTLPQGRG